jgi:Zn-dependent protease
VFAAEPPQTQYDLHFRILGIPVRVHPLFWLMGLILGLRGGDPMYVVIWIGVLFVSILIHELGHAFTMQYFGQNARVVLYMMGGLAIPDSSPWQVRSSRRTRGPLEQILISAAGPGAGFLLAAIVVGTVCAAGGSARLGLLFQVIPFPLVTLPETANDRVADLVGCLLWVNIFWGLINLLPVYPLDGGQIARELFVTADPYAGVARSLWLSVVVGGVIAVAGLVLLKSVFVAILFGVLAFSNYQMLQHFGGGRPW